MRRARRAARAGGRRDARRPARATRTTGSTPTASRSSRRSRARIRRAAAQRRPAAQPARAAGPHARARTCAPAAAERRRALARPGRRSRASDPLTRRGGPEPASLGTDAPECERSALLAGAAPEHEARAQQRDAAEQDRDRGEARERELRVGWRRPRPDGRAGRRCRRRRGWCCRPGALLPESSSPRTSPPPVGVRRCAVLRDARVVAALTGRRRRGRRRWCSAACRARAWSGLTIRDFISCALLVVRLRAGCELRARTRCLIASSSSAVASGRFARSWSMTGCRSGWRSS